jgi:ABC-type branched-subunit amino acid transport system ATPase component
MNFALSIANRAVLTDKGRIVADGDAGEIMSNLELMTNHGLEVPHAIR